MARVNEGFIGFFDTKFMVQLSALSAKFKKFGATTDITKSAFFRNAKASSGLSSEARTLLTNMARANSPIDYLGYVIMHETMFEYIITLARSFAGQGMMGATRRLFLSFVPISLPTGTSTRKFRFGATPLTKQKLGVGQAVVVPTKGRTSTKFKDQWGKRSLFARNEVINTQQAINRSGQNAAKVTGKPARSSLILQSPVVRDVYLSDKHIATTNPILNELNAELSAKLNKAIATARMGKASSKHSLRISGIFDNLMTSVLNNTFAELGGK